MTNLVTLYRILALLCSFMEQKELVHEPISAKTLMF
jgi:hypothetical protein